MTDLVAGAQAELGAARQAAGEPEPESIDPQTVAVAVRGAINNAIGHSLRRRPGPGPDPELAVEGARIAELFARGL